MACPWPRPIFLSFPKSLAPPLAVPAKHHPTSTTTLSLSHRTRAVSAASSSAPPPPSPPPSPPPPARTDSVGPAAPTWGDVYLGRQLPPLPPQPARGRASWKEDAEKRRALAKKTPSGVAYCYGCGAPLHTGEEGSPRYVEPAGRDQCP